MLGMVRWFLSGFHFKTVVRARVHRCCRACSQRGAVTAAVVSWLVCEQGVKKPFNPIIGETFACAWRHEDGSYSQYLAEQVTTAAAWRACVLRGVSTWAVWGTPAAVQVSHHPPVTAMYFENRTNHIVMTAQVWTK